MSGDPAEHEPYSVSLSGQARRNIREHLPLEVAAAALETIEGSIAVNPHRAGKPLDEPFDGFYAGRRGTYRIVSRIDEAKRLELGERSVSIADVPELLSRWAIVEPWRVSMPCRPLVICGERLE